MRHSGDNVQWEAVSRLAALCDELARERGVERYKILQKKTMYAIAETMPATLDELRTVKGIGPKKAAEFGVRIVAAIHGAPAVREEKKQARFAEEGEKAMSVGDFLGRLNDMLAGEATTVRGEIAEFRPHPTGAYFSLKDKNGEGILPCYMSPYAYRNLGVELEDGMEVYASGRPEIYRPKGRFSFIVTRLTLAGEGSLKKAYELLKKKLEAEGLFARKRPLPEFMGRIGIITSKTGAVIGDFKRNIAPRGIVASLYDVRVEGLRAVPEILAALVWFNAHAEQFDVLVIIRGGGSIEDLQPFNDERVARAVFASKIPTICGIGHDRDAPIASLVGDREVSTPSIAAMLVNQSWDRLVQGVPLCEERILSGFARILRAREAYVRASAERLMSVFSGLFGELRTLTRALRDGFSRLLARSRQSLVHYERYLAAVDPERNLRLGYGIVFDEAGRVVRAAKAVPRGAAITVKLHHGALRAKVEEQLDDNGTEQK